MYSQLLHLCLLNPHSLPIQLPIIPTQNNGWIWEVGGVRILVDPWLEDALDFGIPWFYKAFKKKLRSYGIKDLPPVDLVLLTQSLDDHAHMKTLVPLSQVRPDLPVLTVPSAVEKLKKTSFKNVITPIVSQELPFYTLVAGGEKAARLTKLLGAKYVVPCFNADMEATGILNVVVNSIGDADKFTKYLRDAGSDARIVRPEPGEPFALPLRE
eukprot:jgi/Chlat1/4669/Chrsp3S05610